MTKDTIHKKRLVVSYNNLPSHLQDEVKKKYPGGFTESMMRIDKGPGNFFYAVVFETEDASYLVKIDVKVDGGNLDDDEEKEYYNDEIKGADELADTNEEDEDD